MSSASKHNPAFDLTRIEDYLEAVYELIQTKGYARPVEIAELLDIKTPSVTNMLQRLDKLGLVRYERYRGATLTVKGERLARFTQKKHLTLIKFLKIMGIEEATANLDAEGIEHHVHKSTINRIGDFVEFVEKHPSWFKAFGAQEP